MKQRNNLPESRPHLVRLPRCTCRITRIVAALTLLFGTMIPAAWAQASATPASQDEAMAAAIRDLQQEVRELREAVAEVKSEAAQYRAETTELRRELRARPEPSSAESPSVAESPATASQASPQAESSEQSASATQTPPPSIQNRISSLEESSQLLNGKINEQYQTKVESASKYRVRLSGIVLMNLFSTRGATDNQVFPTWADPVSAGSPSGSVGATMRQSEIGLEVFGPTLAGAKTSAEAQFDFAGGFPDTVNGATSGLFRMRTASMRLDWEHTSIIAGQDSLFLSPQSPSSFASLAVPEFSYAGNLWGWIPQLRVEHRFDLSDVQQVTVQAGILDNLDGEQPYASPSNQPQAGEASGQPAYAARTAWSHVLFGRPFTLGAAGYYSPQYYGFSRHVDGWAGMSDWEIPLFPRLSLTGEFYRGFAIGGIGGALGRSVLFAGDSSLPTSQVRGLNDIGGWSQLKFRATAKLEFNGGFGLDNPYAKDLRAAYGAQGYFASLYINRGAMGNFIYRPRSNLLFSAEYRHLRTFYIDGGNPGADQVNLMMGVLF